CTRALRDRKAYDLVVLETGKVSSIADYFVICSGRSDTQVQALAEAVEEQMAARGARPLSVGGFPPGPGVWGGYGDVVVPIFYVPVRQFYALERLWPRAPRVELPEPFQ